MCVTVDVFKCLINSLALLSYDEHFQKLLEKGPASMEIINSQRWLEAEDDWLHLRQRQMWWACTPAAELKYAVLRLEKGGHFQMK